MKSTSLGKNKICLAKLSQSLLLNQWSSSAEVLEAEAHPHSLGTAWLPRNSTQNSNAKLTKTLRTLALKSNKQIKLN
jgi:hypothetical protein